MQNGLEVELGVVVEMFKNELRAMSMVVAKVV